MLTSVRKAGMQSKIDWDDVHLEFYVAETARAINHQKVHRSAGCAKQQTKWRLASDIADSLVAYDDLVPIEIPNGRSVLPRICLQPSRQRLDFTMVRTYLNFTDKLLDRLDAEALFAGAE
jgi:hypothetical protein